MLIPLLSWVMTVGGSSLYFYPPAFRKCTEGSGLWRFQREESRCDKLKPPDYKSVDFSMKAVKDNSKLLKHNLLTRKFLEWKKRVELN